MIGIIGALDVEIAGIKSLMSNVDEQIFSKIKFYKGDINGNKCVLAQCGVGKVNAAMCTQTMILMYNPDKIINTGVAGALDRKLHICDIVISDKVVHHDSMNILDEGQKNLIEYPRGAMQFSDESIITELLSDKALADRLEGGCRSLNSINVYRGTVASGDQFISGKTARLEIGKYFNALCCEMEGASIGQVCYRNDVPFVILRAISDTVETNDYMDFEKFKYVASDEILRVIKAFFDAE